MLKNNWKAWVAFGALVVANLAANYANSSTVTPQNGWEWVALVATTAGGTWAVWQKGNAVQGKHAKE